MMRTKNKVYYVGTFDPITNNDLKIIDKLLKLYDVGIIILDGNSELNFDEKLNIINFIFEDKIKIIKENDNDIKDNVYILKDSIAFCNKKYKLLVIDESNNLDIELDNIGRNNIIYMNDYHLVDKRIRDSLLFNLSYLDHRLKPLMDDKRYKHSLNVGEMSKEIAISCKYSEIKKAIVAGTLHDIAKRFSKDTYIEYLSKNSLSELLEEPDPVLHSYVGGLYLKEKWLIDDDEIVNAVFFHTVGHENMTMLEKIVFCADKVSCERNYNDVGNLRALCLKNIDEGFIELLKIQHQVALSKNGKDKIGKMLLKTFEYYIK